MQPGQGLCFAPPVCENYLYFVLSPLRYLGVYGFGFDALRKAPLKAAGALGILEPIDGPPGSPNMGKRLGYTAMRGRYTGYTPAHAREGLGRTYAPFLFPVNGQRDAAGPVLPQEIRHGPAQEGISRYPQLPRYGVKIAQLRLLEAHAHG